MKLAILGNDESFQELTQRSEAVEWVRAGSFEDVAKLTDIAGFFNLNDDASAYEYAHFSVPVFINCVSETVGHKTNITRINGWMGFLQNDTWEIAGNYSDLVKTVFENLNKKVILTADVPGFISASVIAMIINEAYYAKDEKISTEEEIDLAMKLGTNYPYGPFEWAKRIGLKNIFDLLESMSKENKKYTPSPLLTQAMQAL